MVSPAGVLLALHRLCVLSHPHMIDTAVVVFPVPCTDGTALLYLSDSQGEAAQPGGPWTRLKRRRLIRLQPGIHDLCQVGTRSYTQLHTVTHSYTHAHTHTHTQMTQM